MHRWYQPRTGRYGRADPLGLAGGINSFACARSSPLNLVDILGLEADDKCENIKVKAVRAELP